MARSAVQCLQETACLLLFYLEDTSSSSKTPCVVQQGVNGVREANAILRSGNAPKNAERSKGRFGEAEPAGRSGVCAKATPLGVS